LANLRGKSVLEVGLGYGTVSQKLAEGGAFFTGFDTADNPVAMVTHRYARAGYQARLPRVILWSRPSRMALSMRS
jgi:2-polyprenyl-3-methyl-5-hydroxy-6-metoxy-1,4-benzoquinol methylase